MNNQITVLDRLMVVNLNICIWSARKKLTPADLNGAELPPEDLATLGSKRICDPDELKIFGTLKARAVSLLDKHGVRFLSGWAIPENKADKLASELNAIGQEFAHAKQLFLQRYDLSIQDWIGKHPSWASMIAGSLVSGQYVSSRLSFNWQMFKVAASGALQGNSMQEQADNLGYTLFDEIARAAKDTWQRCFAKRAEITRKALSPLKTIQQKLLGLSFLEPRVMPISELISAALNSVPKRGNINGSLLIMLQGLVSLLQNPSALMQHGELILQGHQAQDILSSLLTAPDSDKHANLAVTHHLPKYERRKPAQPAVIESRGLW